MQIVIEEPGVGEEDKIIIRCRQVTPELIAAVAGLKGHSKPIIGYEGEKIHQIELADIFYFEAVDNRVFIYCKADVFECRQKLYEIEQVLSGGSFLRASKSVVINLKKVEYLSPAFNGRFEGTLSNGEKVIISRQYVPELKRRLDM